VRPCHVHAIIVRPCVVYAAHVPSYENSPLVVADAGDRVKGLLPSVQVITPHSSRLVVRGRARRSPAATETSIYSLRAPNSLIPVRAAFAPDADLSERPTGGRERINHRPSHSLATGPTRSRRNVTDVASADGHYMESPSLLRFVRRRRNRTCQRMGDPACRLPDRDAVAPPWRTI
jgi:hypothetical protein